ncbi:hypothetical protein J7T55_002154 [Diaporthe amygdali]|uniref:uncharacterized protein n=1 Tax=Phomopsis amygdali TaxID=1214568 RepID=UPI0022FEE797|nr:uncharacterized protein J7T55_002154 [Diaporthe amygdali]KAJ0108550.1 hypothetical protein J7T55_002154 [Diaporthe amygdali]
MVGAVGDANLLHVLGRSLFEIDSQPWASILRWQTSFGKSGFTVVLVVITTSGRIGTPLFYVPGPRCHFVDGITGTMGWLFKWMVQGDGRRPRLTSNEPHEKSPLLDLRDSRGNQRGNGNFRNRPNGGRRGDKANEQGGDGGDGDGGKNNNNDNGNKDTTFFVHYDCSLCSASNNNYNIFSTHLRCHNDRDFNNDTNTNDRQYFSHKFYYLHYSPHPNVLLLDLHGRLLVHTPDTNGNNFNYRIDCNFSTEQYGIALAALSTFALILGGLYLYWRRTPPKVRSRSVFSTGRPTSMRSSTSNTQDSLTQGAADMAQTGSGTAQRNGGEPVDTSSWRTWHPWRPRSTQSDVAAAVADLLEPPAPEFLKVPQEARTTQATWETSSEPESSAADRLSAPGLATYLSPAPGRPRRIPEAAGSARV